VNVVASDRDQTVATDGSASSQTPYGEYDIAPVFSISEGSIESGYESLAHVLAAAERNGARNFAIDGFQGVPWDQFRAALDKACRSQGLVLAWQSAYNHFLDDHQFQEAIRPFLGQDDPVFGRLFDGSLRDLFQRESVRADRQDHASRGPVAYYGPGAALLCTTDVLVYVDVPKDLLQQWMREGTASNIGAQGPSSFAAMYKRAYFVDWPILNRHKAEILAKIDLFVDLQNPGMPAWTLGDTLRTALDDLASHPFRVRPWFSPGPWGGQWMKRHFRHLDQDVPNYAWSFELIVPENGLVLASASGNRLECSFDLLMFRAHERVLGRAAERFGYNFPIRFDYLDTIEGGNLSIQCHPRPEYIRDQFGEPFTQDESYYIVQAEPGATVYLGFRDEADVNDFRAAVEESASSGTSVDVDAYVNAVPSHQHDLFLIPHGTIHSSGKGNLVLEISATPYIYTFKIYDWMRRDLEGMLRPLNIKRAWDNLYIERGESYVDDHLVAKPRVLAEGPGWRELVLGTHEDIFYAVHRYELSNSLTIETDGRCHVLNIVEGQGVAAETTDGRRFEFHLAETFVIPAAANSYKLIPLRDQPCRIVKAFVK
jgi:mannose-6-phosphate isomerase class I